MKYSNISHSRSGHERVLVLLQETLADGEEFPIAFVVHLAQVRLLARILAFIFQYQMLQEEAEQIVGLGKL